MKKLWAGIAILAALLGVGLVAASLIQHVHEELSDQLETAAEWCKTDWQKADSLTESAKVSWEQHRHWIAALVDHEPLEEISSLFSQLSLCQSNRDTEEFAAVCLRIADICDTLAEGHMPYWWNLL